MGIPAEPPLDGVRARYGSRGVGAASGRRKNEKGGGQRGAPAIRVWIAKLSTVRECARCIAPRVAGSSTKALQFPRPSAAWLKSHYRQKHNRLAQQNASGSVSAKDSVISAVSKWGWDCPLQKDGLFT